MPLLALDTSSKLLGVALFDGEGNVVAAQTRESPQTSEEVLPTIIDVLTLGGTTCAALSLVAVSVGPGSFTGIRTGIATALGLLSGDVSKILGVPTLEARASWFIRQRKLASEAETVAPGVIYVPALDANAKEYYYTLVPGGSDLPRDPEFCGVVSQSDWEAQLTSTYGPANYRLLSLERGGGPDGALNPAIALGNTALTYPDRYRGRHAALYGKRVNALTLAEREAAKMALIAD